MSGAPAASSSRSGGGSTAAVAVVKRRGFRASVTGAEVASEELPSMDGFLEKLNRKGKWQRRWFSTKNTHLTYAKSKGSRQLLASLDLREVRRIVGGSMDHSGGAAHLGMASCAFSPELSGGRDSSGRGQL